MTSMCHTNKLMILVLQPDESLIKSLVWTLKTVGGVWRRWGIWDNLTKFIVSKESWRNTKVQKLSSFSVPKSVSICTKLIKPSDQSGARMARRRVFCFVLLSLLSSLTTLLEIESCAVLILRDWPFGLWLSQSGFLAMESAASSWGLANPSQPVRNVFMWGILLVLMISKSAPLSAIAIKMDRIFRLF